MNISQPISSLIGSVDFGFLSSEDIKALSVKKIQNSDTFDTLLHPTPGGLYDLSLGAWADNPCATCHLNSYSCPGHIGHIELPVPVYHATFFDQTLRLLRARCAYCSRLKLRRLDINRFVCKLRLLQYGLLREAEQIELLQVKRKKLAFTNGDADMGTNVSEDDDSDDDPDDLIERRNEFVKSAIKIAGGRRHMVAIAGDKVEATAEERRVVIREFMASITKPKECNTCKGISPGYRKDGFNKIFRKPLGDKDRTKMVLTGMKTANPLISALKAKKALLQEKREDREVDEGIVADFEDITEDDEEEEDAEMLEMGNEMGNGYVLDTSAATTRKSTSKSKGKEPDVFVNAQEVYASIAELFEKEKEILNLIYNRRHGGKDVAPLTADMFFVRYLAVPPNKFRPEAKTGDGQIAEAQQNNLYKGILRQCTLLNQIRQEMSGTAQDSVFRQRGFGDLQNAWVGLQDAVNSLHDSDRSTIRLRGNQLPDEGIKQKLEKKEGLFRMNMMGKRVNFAARSVISPDPNIETNEIGVPPVFARKLTYPEPVTNHNFYDLKEAVLNGVEKWPGAAAIENENGQVINLRTKNFEERQALANQLLAPSNTNVTGARNKKVHRHLNNGDIVLMNRQPTLHKPSIMGHRARILPGEKTIRMHYANCNTYNADFDGDEMNMHFPQTEIARAEALQIADTDHQYLSATSGKPLRGLIQDHISMGVWLTNKDTFFDRGDYQQLLYSCLRPENSHTTTDRIECVKPAIIKPRPMWTGKQVITTVLKNITPATHPGLTLSGKSQTTGDRWGDDSEEGIVIFRAGELLCGILDKAHLGPSGGGFVHSIYEAYGHTIAGKLLSVLGRLLTKLLHMRAFSCGIEDIVLTPSGDQARQEKLREAETIGREIAVKYVTLNKNTRSDDPELRNRLEGILREDDKQAGLDQVYSSRNAGLSTQITNVCLPNGLRKDFPRNQMQTMTTSGAKGSSVNANQISCNLGQQVLEGRRVPIMISGKTLPSFQPFETKIRAGGYITDRFLSGVKPQEYYFHAMAGREGLIDTAVKTSRSGYLQRCLIKGMEGLKVEYDTSVRDSDGSMVQFLYGEDGLDVTKQKYLVDFKFLAENYLSIFAQLNVKQEFQKIVNESTGEWHKAAMKKVRKTGRLDIVDPVLAVFNPGSAMGSTSETFASAMKAYCDLNPENLLKDKKKAPNAGISKKTFTTLLDMKYMKSVVDPGEAVGIVAGQSIGEPSTQMTLNTFHLAGHSAKNVTLGIPRLREIVMTASNNISTPTMTLHLNPEVTQQVGEQFAKGITKLTLAEVVDKVTIRENVGKGIGYDVAKIFDIRLELYPAVEYQETYAIETIDVLRTLEYRFIPQLIKEIRKELKSKGDIKLLKVSAAQPEVGKPEKTNVKTVGTTQEDDGGNDALEETAENAEAQERNRLNDRDDEDEENDADDDEDNDDAKNSRKKQDRAGAISYEKPDEDEMPIARGSSPAMDDMEDEGYGGSPRKERSEHDMGDVRNEEENVDDGPGAYARERQDRIKSKNQDITRFSFDDDAHSWCEIQLEYDASVAKILMLNLVEEACHSAVVQSIPGIGACTLSEEKVRDPVTNTTATFPVVLTQGINLTAMHDYQHILNPHKIFTNDIAAMLALYGVEACRATIIREMDSVFKGHSITVDNRHLNLIADMMTRGGGFSAFNRTGMASGVSPFMKMSFETTLNFLRDAMLENDWDDLRGPSARIVVGKSSKVGTGAFDVLMPVA
ncbi:hypothetical protein MMC34_007221 [Xylographa carneopallida]|nr:hypothetical protein [Xylographa carneopallida]